MGFYGGNALIGPTLGNFTDLCQLPLAVFALILGLQRRMGWLILSAAVLIPLIREETGIMLIALIIWGAGWMVLVTNAVMPLFWDDNSKRFMVENFGQYLDVDPSEGASSLSELQKALGQSLTLLKELISPQAKLSCTCLVMDSQQAHHSLDCFCPKAAMTRFRSPFATRCWWCPASASVHCSS